MSNLKGNIKMNDQECEGKLSFFGNRMVMTQNFKNTFKNEADAIVFTATAMVMEAHPDGADYMQTFKYEESNGKSTDFWLIIDKTEEGCQNILTALLPEDY